MCVEVKSLHLVTKANTCKYSREMTATAMTFHIETYDLFF